MQNRSAYQKKKKAFSNSCRIYISQKSQLLEFEKKYPFLKVEPATEDSAILHVGIFSNIDEAQKIVYAYKHVKESTEYVESVFNDIEKKCGYDAKTILWKLYVDGNTMEVVAREYGIGIRTLSVWKKEWMEAEFGDGAVQL